MPAHPNDDGRVNGYTGNPFYLGAFALTPITRMKYNFLRSRITLLSNRSYRTRVRFCGRASLRPPF